MLTVALEARRLTKAFGKKVVLSQVNLHLAEGQCAALCGANGSGKTTLLRCLASLVRPSGGEVRWFGQLAARASGNPAIRRMVGMVAHESCLYPHLTVRDNLLFAARMCSVPQPHERVDEWLREIGLTPMARRLPARISRGMRQRLAIARAVVHQPRILLLDEPFSGLDAAGCRWLVRLLADFRSQGRTICFATHDQEMVRRLADCVLYLQAGQLQFSTLNPQLSTRNYPSARAS